MSQCPLAIKTLPYNHSRDELSKDKLPLNSNLHTQESIERPLVSSGLKCKITVFLSNHFHCAVGDHQIVHSDELWSFHTTMERVCKFLTSRMEIRKRSICDSQMSKWFFGISSQELDRNQSHSFLLYWPKGLLKSLFIPPTFRQKILHLDFSKQNPTEKSTLPNDPTSPLKLFK